ncbi:hypothetical protein FPZ12_045120 [Amycolatopsis acidicola]|uniref:Phospholipase/carboxylesterase/thioesterase domain-containing protein n=1 Tax=Amycolatopsis acidicola TaxID=2596893 RepID=A0A5N0UKX9_9PSEU|nr:hypothetical protein [Amycolatopsis acidicola]KAA9148130.1 hypothetical protein FPZ12_045120 [Amycolatopsis acidicola]
MTTLEQVQVQGRTRTLTVVGPCEPAPGSPAVLVFHGSNQSAAKFRAFSGGQFDRYAEGGAVVAYLDGYRAHWNDARVSTSFHARRDGIDDVAFARAVFALLARKYGTAEQYAIGYSNGGQLVIRLAHEIPGELAGIALLSATQPAPENFAPDSPRSRPLPAILFHGTKDPLVPYDGGVASMWGFRPRGLGLSAPETAAYYAERNGITAAPTSRRLTDSVERLDYRQEGTPPVSLVTVHGGGHTVPGPKKAPRIMGRTTTEVQAADLVAEFFGLST